MWPKQQTASKFKVHKRVYQLQSKTGYFCRKSCSSDEF